MNALDLTRQEPRAPRETLAGLVWLPRLIDKARAKQAGTLGDFDSPCPMDRLFADTLGVPINELVSKINEGLEDQQLAVWLEQRLGLDETQKRQANQNLLGKAA